MTEDHQKPEDWRSQALKKMDSGAAAAWILDQLESHKLFYAEKILSERENYYNNLHIFGLRTIILIFTLNGGGIVLLLAAIGNIHGSGNTWPELAAIFRWAFLSFGIGVVLSVSVPAFGYLNALYALKSSMDPHLIYKWLRDDLDGEEIKKLNKSGTKVTITLVLAIIASILSALAFAIGLAFALRAELTLMPAV